MKAAFARFGVIVLGGIACAIIREFTNPDSDIVVSTVFYIVGYVCAKYIPLND